MSELHPEQHSTGTKRRWRNRLHEIIFEADTPAGKAFDVALILIIITSVAVVVISTLPFAREESTHRVFYSIEWVFTGLFTIEYILRLISVRRPLRYAFSFFGIIDLLSILPAFLGLFIPGGERLLVIRTLRLLRIFRIFKLVRYLSEARALRHALIQSRHKIAVFITTVVIIILITSAAMHVVEGNAGNEAFDSIPSAMYWAIITMTTVGYGDIIPITSIGKAMTAVLVLVGYSMIIIPTGILTAEFTTQARNRVTTQACRFCMAEDHDHRATFCYRCGKRLNPLPEPVPEAELGPDPVPDTGAEKS